MELMEVLQKHSKKQLFIWIFLLILLTESMSGPIDIACPELDIDTITIHRYSTPYGNSSAGDYKKIKHVTSVTECISHCCSVESCHVAFFFNNSCYMIHCHNKILCKPLQRAGKKFDNSYVAVVRYPETYWDNPVSPGIGSYKAKKLTFADGFYNEEFTPSIDEVGNHLEPSIFERDGLSSDLFGSTLQDIDEKRTTCVYGIETDCGLHEVCITKNSRARSGICVCDEGFKRDSNGFCQLDLVNSQTVPGLVTNATTSQPFESSHGTVDQTMSSTSTPIVRLVVSAGDNVTLRLPDNEVTLSAYAMKPKDDEEDLKYEWTLISHPDGDETGTMKNQNTRNLKLSHLTAGIYTFKVTVTGKNSVGDATVNVTISTADHPNKLPLVVIQPSNVTIKLPNEETVLDGSFSTDDDKIVKYQWEVLQVPIGYAVQLNETPTLQLKHLIPGFYRFKLTVTDSKGASNFTFANVTVQKETDYPPTANSKSEVVIYLPQNEVTLNGNMSTDDKGIKSWEWKKSPDTDKAVDMEGTNSPYLHLSQLEVGVYKFILKVTDTAEQTSTTEVHLFVKPESNTPPAAVAGPDLKVTLPLKNAINLDGSASKDDIKIVSYHWEQVFGPKIAVLMDTDQAIAKASGLIPGVYQFKLTVYDDKNSHSSALLNVTVIQTQNLPPQANAGGDKSISLPCNIVSMNGSASTDDVAVVNYKWVRDPASLAAGTILENSDKSPVLKLTGLISGRYLFRLTVSDDQGLHSSDTASLIVKPPASLMDQIEIIINADIKSFTEEKKDAMLRQLEMLLHVSDPIKVNLIKLDADRNTRRVIMIFCVENLSNDKHDLVRGVEIVSRLRKKLRTDSSLLDSEILSLDTVVCQNNCSGHGSCDQYTKHCICEAFWMQNMFRIYLGDRESNCDWSILYVIIISFTVVVCLAGMIWGIVCCITRLRFRKPKKRHRYTRLLDDFCDQESDKFIPKNKIPKSSVMLSDSESEAIYESQRLPLSVKVSNGVSNGLVRDSHKIKA